MLETSGVERIELDNRAGELFPPSLETLVVHGRMYGAHNDWVRMMLAGKAKHFPALRKIEVYSFLYGEALVTIGPEDRRTKRLAESAGVDVKIWRGMRESNGTIKEIFNEYFCYHQPWKFTPSKLWELEDEVKDKWLRTPPREILFW